MMMGYIMKLLKTLRDLLPREECRAESESFARAIKAVFDSAWHEDRSELGAYMLDMLEYGISFSLIASRIAVIFLNGDLTLLERISAAFEELSDEPNGEGDGSDSSSSFKCLTTQTENEILKSVVSLGEANCTQLEWALSQPTFSPRHTVRW